MADMTEEQWATLVLQDLGAPVSQNNLSNMMAWMASENSWPPPRNNPLNNGLGSGGGSGLGSYPDLATAAQYAAQGMQGGITGAAGIGQALVADAPFATFHDATISATWSGDHYAGTDWLGATSPATMGVTGPNPLAALAALSPTDQAAMRAAIAAPGGAAYFQALAAQQQQSHATTAVTGASGSSANASVSTNIGGTVYTGTAQQTGALGTIETNLANYDFTPTQITQLTNWAWGEVVNNVDPSQVAIDIQNQPAFIQQFPFFHDVNAALIAQGQQPLAPSDYMGLTRSYQQAAQAAGLPTGFFTAQDAATLMKGNVSPNELSDRLNTAISYTLSTPAAQDAFNQYFGSKYGQSGTATPLTLGQMAAIVLDPTKAEPVLQQELTTAQIGGASVTSGVGSLDAATATKLAQAGISVAQATNAFQNLAPLSALEHARPGMGGEAAQGVVSADQLATGQLLGNPEAQRQLQTALEVAKAPFAGGGGPVQSSKGAVGAGSSSGQGAGGT